MRKATCLVVLLALLMSPALADEVLEDSWERLHLAGSHAGFVHTVVRQVEAGDGSRIETTVHTEMKINRLGNVIEIVTDEVTWETLEGELLQVECTTRMTGQEEKTRFSFDGRKVKMAVTVLGQTRESDTEVPEGVRGPRAIERRTAALAGTSGEVVEVISFMADMKTAVRVTSTSKGPESVDLLHGRKAELTRVESTLEGLPIKPIGWLDEEGRTQKTRLAVAGLLFESYRVESEEAAKPSSLDELAGPAPDVFEMSLIREPGPVPLPRRVEAAVVEMRAKTEGDLLPVIESEAHHVIEVRPGLHVIHARRSEPPAWVDAPRPVVDPPAEAAEALLPNSMVQSDAGEIIEIVEKVVGDEPHAWRAAQKLERWVFTNLTNKGFGVAFASALEVCRNREGDCTEHAVLLAALCRAAGIPTRVVMGVEYIMGIWGGHAWNEVWIDGTWYALDATNGFGFVDPLHLPLAHMTLKDTGFAQEFSGLLGGIGNLELDVVEVTRCGARIRVNDPALVKTEGRWYTDRAWRIACRAPDGFEFDPPRRQGMSARLLELEGKNASGQPCEIRIAALDTPPTGSWTEVLRGLRRGGMELREVEVDGRPARRGTQIRDGRTRERVAVLVGPALFLLEMDGVEGDAERTAFEAFLDSVDFDVR